MSRQKFFAVTQAAILATLSLALVGQAVAQESNRRGLDRGQYIPGIWVDPDGCEHWVMDDGAEGYMTPHVNRNGIPVCRPGVTCGIAPDALFASGSAAISPAAQGQLRDFFRRAGTQRFAIIGHTDNVASAASNEALSLQRAQAVAAVARSAGASVRSVQGYGARQPVASNGSSEGRAANRRVEIICIR